MKLLCDRCFSLPNFPSRNPSLMEPLLGAGRRNLSRGRNALPRSPPQSRTFLHEVQTAAKLAERAKALGYEVTTGVGGTGIVAVMKNGAGPTVLFRTDMDALPVEEKTGLPYASKVVTKNDAGVAVRVMQACGHDIHMSSWFGTAKLMAANKDRWKGTLILIGQPAEELVTGPRHVERRPVHPLPQA